MTIRPLFRPVALAGAAVLLLGACSGSATSVPSHAPTFAAPYASAAASPSAAPAASASPATSAAVGPGTGSTGCPTSAPAPMAAADTATVTLATAKGNIVIKITGSMAPNATGNFVALASCGFYDGVVFHRLVPGFVIQGGDGQFGRAPNVEAAHVGTGGPGYSITDDSVTTLYKRGTVAMARTSTPNSQGSQFFIVLSDGAAPALSSANTYAIMGEVTSGMDTVDAIAAMPNSGEPDNAALDPRPIITKATVTRP
jgi:peptidyl-prolyl cis-trans isomerase B (cyclophilin B)